MQPDPAPTAVQKPQRLRWFQWRLRSLFVLTLLVAIGMSYVAVEMQHQRKQKAAADAIVKAGGRVDAESTWLGRLLRDDSLVSVTDAGFVYPLNNVTDTELAPIQDLHELYSLDIIDTQVTDAGLAYLQGLTQLESLDLTKTKITNDGLKKLQHLTQLVFLFLSHTKITDDGLVCLQRFPQLFGLELSGLKVTNAGLVHLQGLSRLLWLKLDGTQVTDAGLVHLQCLSQLDTLFLNDTQITDAGLDHLAGMDKLQTLNLSNTKVTAQGVNKLRQALPNCKIERLMRKAKRDHAIQEHPNHPPVPQNNSHAP